MTMIDVDTSPLQAAREWRGIGLVAAAMTSGLPVAQAEALEEGDPSAFATIDEMIAAAVVYGSSIGIGRDEAMALLDRTVCRTGADVQLPDLPAQRPAADFSEAVHERSARIATREAVTTTPIAPPYEGEFGAVIDRAPVAPSWIDDHDEDVLPGLHHDDHAPIAPRSALPAVPHGPTPEQAVAASGEIHIDDAFGPEAPWERTGYTSELEAWAEDQDIDPVEADRVRRPDGVASRMAAGTHAAIERLVGTERADAFADWMATTVERVQDTTRDGRERLRRSEHATLFVAIGGGAILIAVLVALGGALGKDEPAGPGPADRSAVKAAVDPAAPKAAATPAPAKLGPMLAPSKLTLDVFNAGSKKGYAKEVAAKLEGYGYRIATVTNSKSDYPGATIIHPADLAREAKVLARRTGIGTLQVAPGTSRKITIVVT